MPWSVEIRDASINKACSSDVFSKPIMQMDLILIRPSAEW